MEVEVIGDIGFPSEIEDMVYESPFHRPDCLGTSGFQVLHYLCYGFFRFSVSGAFLDISEDVLFFPYNFQPFQRTYCKESQGEQGDVRVVIGSGPVVRSSGQGIGFPHAFPGRWCRTKSKRARNKDQRACLRLSFLAVRKYSRFLWLVQTSNPSLEPSRKCLHSSMARMMANISLSWIS